ncbi:MAG: ferrous iron transport protein A [Candidatus Xiphinematobacter sp.]|nr:MAG: ferrous iron transport protein A [Candidatus Xiphinematobacter sp.]
MKSTIASENCTTLRYAKVGQPLRLIQLNGEPAFCHRLREMGLCETVRFRKVSGGVCLICWVCGVRLAFSHQLADGIVVAPCEEVVV